jgi:hypothetical protein
MVSYLQTSLGVSEPFFHSPRTSAIQKDWFVRVKNGNGCSSQLGRDTGYFGIGQPLSLNVPSCFSDWSPTENSICEFV